MCDEEERENEILVEEYRWLVLELFSQVLQQLHHAKETITKLKIEKENVSQVTGTLKGMEDLFDDEDD